MTRHECKYWKLNIKYHYRHCEFCNRYQYDYGGVWKDEVKLNHFINHYCSLGSTSGERDINQYDVVIYCGQFFEYWAYEGWGQAIQVKIKDIIYGPFPNLNCAMWNIDKELEKTKNESRI
jgi:hypothetical protein